MRAAGEKFDTFMTEMTTKSFIMDLLQIFAGSFQYFFRGHIKFQGFSGFFSGVPTISGVFQGFQGFQGSVATLGKHLFLWKDLSDQAIWKNQWQTQEVRSTGSL